MDGVRRTICRAAPFARSRAPRENPDPMPHRTRARPQALPGRDELYRLLVENVTDYAIILLSPDGRVSTWTEGATRMFGHDEDDVLGQPLAILYPPDEVNDGVPARDLRTAIRDGRCETVAWRVRRDGSRLWASVVLTAIHDASGRLIGFGQITRDLTERKEVAERYEESRQRYRHPDPDPELRPRHPGTHFFSQRHGDWHRNTDPHAD